MAKQFGGLRGGAAERARARGTFALASQPETALPGAVSFRTGRGWRLDVQGRLTPPGTFERFGPIVGVTSGAEDLTLVEAGLQSERASSGVTDGERYEQEFRAPVGFVGAKLMTPDERRFRSGSFSFTQLVPWADEPIRAAHDIDDDSFRLNEITPREADVDGTTVGLFLGSSRLHGRMEFPATRTATFYVANAPPYVWTEWMGEFVNPLTTLLDIATLTPSTPEAIRFDLSYEDGEGDRRPPREVRVLYDAVRVPAKATKPQISHRMLFTAKELPGGFEDFIPRWFDVYRRYREVLILGVASAYDRIGFLDNQFLNVVAAAEIYHRIAYPDATILEPAEYERRVTQVVEPWHGDMRRWIKGQFRGGNKPYLELRMAALLRAAQPEVAFRGDVVAIAKRISDTRNYLTHRDESRSQDAAGPRGQIRLMQTVWFCLVAELLKKTGFTSDFTRDRLGRDVRCRSLRERDLLAEDEPEDA